MVIGIYLGGFGIFAVIYTATLYIVYIVVLMIGNDLNDDEND